MRRPSDDVLWRAAAQIESWLDKPGSFDTSAWPQLAQVLSDTYGKEEERKGQPYDAMVGEKHDGEFNVGDC